MSTTLIATRVTSIQDFFRWKDNAPPGARVVYHSGNLAEARADVKNAPHVRRTLDELADKVNDLWYLGEILLFQKRRDYGFDYIAERSKPPYKPRKESTPRLNYKVRHLSGPQGLHKSNVIAEPIERGKILSLHDFRDSHPKLIQQPIDVVPNLPPSPEEHLTGCLGDGMETDGYDEGTDLDIDGGTPEGQFDAIVNEIMVSSRH